MSELSIFSSSFAARTVTREPAEEVENTEAPYVPTWCEVALEHEILAALDVLPHPTERLATAFERKERELMSIFAKLTIADAKQLHKRLTVPVTSDPIARKFGQLVIDRRQRLVTFLADARRREAIQRSSVNQYRGVK